MKYLKQKDLKKRKLYTSFEQRNLLLKVLFINASSKNKLTLKKNLFFAACKNKLFSKTKLVRRCLYTNRSRGSSRTFGISRCLYRELLGFGLFPGYKKAVW